MDATARPTAAGLTVTGLTAALVAGRQLAAEPVISPDGRWAAWAAVPASQDGSPLATLWAARTDAGTPPVALTSGQDHDRLPGWGPGSSWLYFASGSRLNRVRPDGGPPELVVEWPGAVSGLVPLAGGGLAVIAAPAGTAGADPLVWGKHRPPHRLWLPATPADPGTAWAAASGLGDRHVQAAVQRPDGGPLAVLTWAVPDDEPGAFTARLHLADPVTGQARDLGPAGLDARQLTWWRSGDGWRLGYLAVTPPGPVGGTAVFALAVPASVVPADVVPADGTDPGGPPGHRSLTAGQARCPVALAQAGGGPPLALFAAGLDTEITLLEPASRIFSRLAVLRGELDSLTASDTGDLIVARYSCAYQPADVHAGPPSGPLRRLSALQPELRGLHWGRQQRLAWRAADGLALDGLLVLPPGAAPEDGPFPLVTVVHGGPYDRYADSLQLTWAMSGQWLAAAGLAVFLPNPRGSSGHGHEFAARVAGAVGQEEWTDVLAGIDHLVAAGLADPGRLGIGGWSHGGFMAAWAIGQTSRFRAAVMGAGIADWGLQTGVGELGEQEAGLAGSAGWEGPGPHRHDELSPVSYATRVRTPVLILHGQQDTNVPVGQAVYFYRALRHYSAPAELVIYPGEGHSIRGRQHQEDVLERSRDWFCRWLS
jgi:dienelactone hydrolase